MGQKRTLPLKSLRWHVAFTIDYRGRNGGHFCFLFHGATYRMLRTVFDKMRPVCGEYYIDREHMYSLLHAHSSFTDVVSFYSPNTELLSPEDWAPIISRLFEASYKCDITYYKNLEKFLNS